MIQLLAAGAAGGVDTTSILVTLGIAVVTSSALAAGLTGLLNRRKISSEAENIQAQTSDLVWQRVKDSLDRQDEQILELQNANIRLLRRVEDAEDDAILSRERADDAERLAREVIEVVRAYQGRVEYLEQLMRGNNIPFDPWEPPALPDLPRRRETPRRRPESSEPVDGDG